MFDNSIGVLTSPIFGEVLYLFDLCVCLIVLKVRANTMVTTVEISADYSVTPETTKMDSLHHM